MNRHILYLVLEAPICVVFGLLGTFLYINKAKSPLKRRSPILLMLSHLGLFVETSVVLLMLSYSSNREISPETQKVYQFLTIVFHFVYFCPMVLRSIRVYLIFELNTSNAQFDKRIHMASQKWLLKMFGVLIAPVVLLGALNFFVPKMTYYFPVSYSNTQPDQYVDDLIYVFMCFVEELVLVVLVYLLRNASDNYSMTWELVVVCFIWMANSFFSILSGRIWQVQLVIRNLILLVVTIGVPTASSFKAEVWNESLTLEMLDSFELILENSLCLEGFESFLEDTKNTQAQNLLNCWIKCEMYRANPTQELEKEIVCSLEGLDYQDLDSQEKLQAVAQLQLQIFDYLKGVYFAEFKNSDHYRKLKLRIQRQDIFKSRIMQTSFAESQSLYALNPNIAPNLL